MEAGFRLATIDGAVVAHDNPTSLMTILRTYHRHGRSRAQIVAAHPDAGWGGRRRAMLAPGYWADRYRYYRAAGCDAGQAAQVHRAPAGGAGVVLRRDRRVLVRSALVMSGAADAAVVDVIVPVRDGGSGSAPASVPSARRAGVTTRIIVVDNGSTDGSLAVAEELADLVLVEPRPGSYAARNRGIGATTAEVVAFTDADCIPEPTWLSTAVAVLDGGGDLCAGAIVHEPATTWVGRFDERCYLDQQSYVARWRFGATANLVVRRAVLTSLGGFLDELVSGGDVEFGRRATSAGFRLEFASDSVVHHEARATLAGVTRKAWRHGRGHAQLARRQADAPWPWSRRLLVPSPALVRLHWRRPTVLLLALWHDLVVALGHLHERRHGRPADLRRLVLVSSWWPTEDQPAAYPFIVDHLEALRGLGEVEAWAVRPGIRGPKEGTGPVPSLGIDVRRVPVPWHFVLRPGGSRLLELLGMVHGWRTHRRDAVVVHSSEFAGPWAVGLARVAGTAPLRRAPQRRRSGYGDAGPGGAADHHRTTRRRRGGRQREPPWAARAGAGLRVRGADREPGPGAAVRPEPAAGGAADRDRPGRRLPRRQGPPAPRRTRSSSCLGPSWRSGSGCAWSATGPPDRRSRRRSERPASTTSSCSPASSPETRWRRSSAGHTRSC